jgi:hypothetical protein
MSIHPAPPPAGPPADPAGASASPAPAREGETPAEDLDLEEDIAPNLGGEDQMQDA